MSLSIHETQALFEEIFGICRFVVSAPNDEPEEDVSIPVVSHVETTSSVGETVEDVGRDLGACERCNLCESRRHLVFGTGPLRSDVLLIGEAPGAEEDDQGVPFVGASGKKLDAMLENVLGLDRNRVYVTNALKCRPPKNRVPNDDEMQACRPFLLRQIRAVSPKIVILFGSTAVKALFPSLTVGVSRLRGRWLDFESIPVMPTFHPSYLLHSRRPGSENSPENLEYRKNTRWVWADLVEVRDRMDALGIQHDVVTSRP